MLDAWRSRESFFFMICCDELLGKAAHVHPKVEVEVCRKNVEGPKRVCTLSGLFL